MLDNNNLKTQIQIDFDELEKYKSSYKKKIALYNLYLNTMDFFKTEASQNICQSREELYNKINEFETQIKKIDQNLNLLNKIKYDLNMQDEQNTLIQEDSVLNLYNNNYFEIKNNCINNFLYNDELTINYISNILEDFNGTLKKVKEKSIEEMGNNNIESNNEDNLNNILKNNDTLIISEKLGKVILPYTTKEVLETLNDEDNDYKSVDEVIENVFTRNFDEFKSQYSSRYKETMKLARERENFGLIDSISLAAEMMKKRYLHPAIIAACKTLDDLDVYIDCLDKNELDDFKIFKIKYELYPILAKKKEKKKGTRYKENTEIKFWNKLKKIFVKENTFEEE